MTRFRLIRGFPAGALIIAASTVFSGCFYEKSFPMETGDYFRVRHETASPPISTRKWLAQTHGRLQHLLPAFRRTSLLTDDLVDERNVPRDVFKFFQRDPDRLQSVFCNFWGLMFSAQCIGASSDVEALNTPWPGFEEVSFPISDTVETYGWLGLVKDGETVRKADCIVLLPGFFGDNCILRQKDLADALLASGFHVLAYESRGLGVTNLRRPEIYHNFGALETHDLMIVSDWLEEKPFIRHTGLIGYCWGANQALLTSWYENCLDGHASISDRLAEHLPPLPERRRFRAGVLSFSPTLAFEEIIDKLDQERKFLSEPALSALQGNVELRMTDKQHPEISGSLRKLIDYEFARSELNYPGAVRDSLRFLRFLPYKDRAVDKKLEYARLPVIVVYGSNDPLAPSQEVVELLAGLDNPNVAAVILYGGGHVGFPAYARSYYFSLIMNFFDPVHGAAAMARPSATIPGREVQTMNIHAR
ncbi:MAG: alpha/beta fold hydrolase [Phycisphaerales bacterium]|nr:alpha/beta fold hydrolase [Phycisphaerales bacterium]